MEKNSKKMESCHHINKKTIFFVAGKSGGHIIPALTCAYYLQESGIADHVVLFSTHTPLDRTIIESHTQHMCHIPLPLQEVPSVNKWHHYPLFFIRLCWSFFVSLYYMLQKKPISVVSMGGLVSLPVCYAAYMLRIPFELYEFNAIPGRATSHLAPWATTISLCFEQAQHFLPKEKCRLVNYPIRGALKNASPALVHKAQWPTLFIMGGSQGSILLNTLIQKWLIQHPEWHQKIHIIHQTGKNECALLTTFYQQLNISARVFDYHPHLEHIYPLADVLVIRAGAGALFEALYLNKKSIVIPLETAITSHQKYNARALASTHPDLFTVITHTDIAHNPFMLYDALNKKLNNHLH